MKSITTLLFAIVAFVGGHSQAAQPNILLIFPDDVGFDDPVFKPGYAADDDGVVELNDLKNDLAQKHKVAAAHPDKVAELTRFLQIIRAGSQTR